MHLEADPAINTCSLRALRERLPPTFKWGGFDPAAPEPLWWGVDDAVPRPGFAAGVDVDACALALGYEAAGPGMVAPDWAGPPCWVALSGAALSLSPSYQVPSSARSFPPRRRVGDLKPDAALLAGARALLVAIVAQLAVYRFRGLNAIDGLAGRGGAWMLYAVGGRVVYLLAEGRDAIAVDAVPGWMRVQWMHAHDGNVLAASVDCSATSLGTPSERIAARVASRRASEEWLRARNGADVRPGGN